MFAASNLKYKFASNIKIILFEKTLLFIISRVISIPFEQNIYNNPR